MSVERTKCCTDCGASKPWSEFYAKTKWPDGSARTVQSYCIECNHQRRRRTKRHQLWRNSLKGKRRREFRAAEAARHRAYYAAKRLEQGKPYRPKVITLESERRWRLPIGPFREWLAWYIAENGMTRDAFAEMVGVNSRELFRWLYETAEIEGDAVDRVLLAEGSTLLVDLYPEAYEEAAAA